MIPFTQIRHSSEVDHEFNTMERRDNSYDNMNQRSHSLEQGEWSPPPPQFEEHDRIYTAQGSPQARSPPSPYSSMPHSPLPPPLSPPLHAYPRSPPHEYQQDHDNGP